MRFRMGKGQTAAFDAVLEKQLEQMHRNRGYYPSLREIGESFSPPQTVHRIYQALHRLAMAGRLSPEAEAIYNSKKEKGVRK